MRTLTRAATALSLLLAADQSAAQENIFPSMVGKWREMNTAFTIIIENDGSVFSQDGKLSGAVERDIEGGGNFAFEGPGYRCAYDIVFLDAPLKGASSWGLRSDSDSDKCFSTGVFIRVNSSASHQQEEPESRYNTSFFNGPGIVTDPEVLTQKYPDGKWGANDTWKYYEVDGDLLGRPLSITYAMKLGSSEITQIDFSLRETFNKSQQGDLNDVSGSEDAVKELCRTFYPKLLEKVRIIADKILIDTPIKEDDITSSVNHASGRCSSFPDRCYRWGSRESKKFSFKAGYTGILNYQLKTISRTAEMPNRYLSYQTSECRVYLSLRDLDQ